MNATDYLNAALRTEYTPDFIGPLNRAVPPHTLARLMHGMIGLCTETGELQDAIKKNLIYGKHLDVTNIVEEIGDVTWYLAIILSACGSSFEEAFAKNIAKLKARFPDKFTEELALNRDLSAERAALEGLSEDQIAALSADDRRAAVLDVLANLVDFHNTTLAARNDLADRLILAAHR